MDKPTFVSRVAERLKVDPAQAEGVVDATLSELITPSVFLSEETEKALREGRTVGRIIPRALAASNNCNDC